MLRSNMEFPVNKSFFINVFAVSIAFALACSLALLLDVTRADAKPKDIHGNPPVTQPVPSETTGDEGSSSAARANIIVGEDDDDEPTGAAAEEDEDGDTPLQTIAKILTFISSLAYVGLFLSFLFHPRRTWRDVRELFADCNPLKYACTRVMFVVIAVAMTALFSTTDRVNPLFFVVCALPYALAASLFVSSKLSQDGAGERT